MKQWNLTTQRCIWSVQAHNGWVRGVTSTRDGTRIISVGDDKTIKHWSSDITVEDNTVPINSIVTQVLILFSNFDLFNTNHLFTCSLYTVALTTVGMKIYLQPPAKRWTYGTLKELNQSKLLNMRMNQFLLLDLIQLNSINV